MSLYHPSEEFASRANVSGMDAYRALYDRAAADPEGFWAELADEQLDWFKKWDQVLDASEAPFYKWFVGGRTNMSHNCLDRHCKTWRKNKGGDRLGR